jgi:hypothetical protein
MLCIVHNVIEVATDFLLYYIDVLDGCCINDYYYHYYLLLALDYSSNLVQ